MILKLLQALGSERRLIVFLLKYIVKPLEFEKFDVFQDRAQVSGIFSNQFVYIGMRPEAKMHIRPDPKFCYVNYIHIKP